MRDGEAAAGLERGGGGGEERASRERESAREDWHRERNAVAILEKRGRARDFSSVAGDRRSRKRVCDQAQIAGRLCGIICLLGSEAEQTLPQTGPKCSSHQPTSIQAPAMLSPVGVVFRF